MNLPAFRTFRFAIILTAAIGVAGVESSSQPAGAPPPPNIVFILIDDLGWKDLGVMGSDFYETPNIDALAAQGMLFTDAYTCGPNCAPTRASLISGQYTPRHNVLTVNSTNRGADALRYFTVPETSVTLAPSYLTPAEVLRGSGYVSASVGKWHLGNDPERGPVAQGFDVNIGGGAWGSPRSPGRYWHPFGDIPNIGGEPGDYLTDRLTEEAIAFIETNKDVPFFLYLPHYAVHTPIQAIQAITDKYNAKPPGELHDNAKYAAMIESVDIGVGRITAKLDELGLADNTVLIVTSDNGQARAQSSAAPLRGWKGQLYEGGIRVPLIVRWPGVVEPGSTCRVPVTSVDFFPTFLAIAAAPVPGQTLDGKSIVPLLQGESSLGRRPLFWHFPAYLPTGTGPLDPWPDSIRQAPASAIRKGDWKLIEMFETGHLELYDLRYDIGEQRNLAGFKRFAPLRDALYQELQGWQQSVGGTIPSQLNPDWAPPILEKREQFRGAATEPGDVIDAPDAGETVITLPDSGMRWGGYNAGAGLPTDVITAVEVNSSLRRLEFRGSANTSGSYAYTIFEAGAAYHSLRLTEIEINIVDSNRFRLMLRRGEGSDNPEWFVSPAITEVIDGSRVVRYDPMALSWYPLSEANNTMLNAMEGGDEGPLEIGVAGVAFDAPEGPGRWVNGGGFMVVEAQAGKDLMALNRIVWKGDYRKGVARSSDFVPASTGTSNWTLFRNDFRR